MCSALSKLKDLSLCPALKTPLAPLRPLCLVARTLPFSICSISFSLHKKKEPISRFLLIPAIADSLFTCFVFSAKPFISERSVTDNNPIQCVTTHHWAKAVALDGLRRFALNPTRLHHRLTGCFIRIYAFSQYTKMLLISRLISSL